MHLIQNNPYRTLGLLVGASATQLNRHRTRIPNYLSAGNEIPSEFTDFSFETLGSIIRTEDSIANAASKLTLDSDKMSSALFWFYKGNLITDEPAFDAIKEADLDQVINIWTKLTSNGEVSQRNASAYSNLATLYLSGILEGTNTNEAILEQGISLKLQFLESDFIKELKAIATDETFKTTKKELQLQFLNQIQNEVERIGNITSNQFLNIISKQEFSAKEDFLIGFIQKPMEQIEKKTVEAKKRRKADSANALNVGRVLYEQTYENIEQLKHILETSDLKLSSISDKVSDEILQCGIDYFSHYKDSGPDRASASMDLFCKAKTLAIGNIAKQRCQENTENLKEWIDEKPERDKQASISVDLEQLKNLIDEFEQRSETIANAKSLLSSSIRYLTRIKNALGENDDLYIGINTRIASDALAMVITEINILQEQVAAGQSNILMLKSKANSAWEVTITIGLMSLKQEFRIRLEQNKISLKRLKDQVDSVTVPKTTEQNFPNWIIWVGAIIILIILFKACN